LVYPDRPTHTCQRSFLAQESSLTGAGKACRRVDDATFPGRLGVHANVLGWPAGQAADERILGLSLVADILYTESRMTIAHRAAYR
jgi:hypothetical protein